jgi:hypothetical protein
MKADSTQPIAAPGRCDDCRNMPIAISFQTQEPEFGMVTRRNVCNDCARKYWPEPIDPEQEIAALTQQVADLQAEVARLRGASPGPCAKCEAPLVVVDGGHWTCYKCALRETEELWSKSARLRECVECGQNSFAISPVHPSQGFCWTCHKLLTIEALAGEKHDG